MLDVDPAEVERILLTLFSNAADAVVDGGDIRIAVSAVRRAGGNGAGLHARLVVEDTGVGMDEHTVARAFEPFFSTKGDRGTGLGLASASSVVQSLGGTITIDSAPGRGTTVEVLLPAIDPCGDSGT
jgi:signal transduction histidine kinase